ncbi:MAG: DUF4157 domain-containing protein [Anaerolineae bacterium]|nr:DUF4157 domain-containing protein [Anaerolineae bacterium]
MERDVLRKIQAERNKSTPEVQEQEKPFDLRTAGPLDLQQMIGNKATTNLLTGAKGTVVQTKMTVTDANDQYEKEADSVAEQIVSGGGQAESAQRMEEEELQAQRIQRMDDAEMSDDDLAMQRLQRQPMEEEEELQAQRIQRQEEEEEMLQPQRIQRNATDMSKSFDVGGDIEDQIRNTGGGQALDGGIQAKMEAGTGHDFSNVQVHTDSQADALSESLGARAFTTGSDIFFKSGEYNPGTTDGDKLIAHESTHVIQQGGTQLKREDD